MNLFQLVLKQMRQRALSTWLTLVSVLLGVALAIAILIMMREGKAMFGQSEYGYDVLIGPAKGSPLQLVLNTVYHIDQSPGLIPYSLYERLLTDPQYRADAKLVVPYAVGDSYENHRIVGTLPKLFGRDDEGRELPEGQRFEYRPGRGYELAEGVVFHPGKFEAVIGADIPARTGLTIGSMFRSTHGLPRAGQTPDIHDQQWKVVGILKPTHTANDRVLFIPLLSFYAISEHEEALADQAKIKQGADPAQVGSGKHDEGTGATGPAATQAGQGAHQHEEEHFTLNADGTIHLKLPKDEWQVSAILVRSWGFPDSAVSAMSLMYTLNTRNEAAAVNPATVMRDFFGVFLEPSAKVLLLISLLVTIVAGVGILVSIYNSVSARMKEIAILRALGATRNRVLTLICTEAGLIGLVGGIGGLVVGHLLGGIGSIYMNARFGEGINWLGVGGTEALYLVAVVGLAVLAGLVPAMKAYGTPVATNLTA